MAKSRIHPQFFHTLAPNFHTHLMIPEDFFIKYIEGTNTDKNSVELKFDASDITWKVKVTGRKLTDGWEEFAVANDFEIGDVVVVRYVGDLVFQVLDLGPNFSDIPPPGNNNGSQDQNGKTLLKKRLCPRDFSSEEEDDMEFLRKKKVRKDNAETESFVATVTASNLRTDTMCLPQHFTSSNGISTTSHQIVLKDEKETSWALDLTFNKSSDTFSITRGWKNFCDDNGQTVGGFFMFKLVENGETPVLSFCPTESTDDTRQRDSSDASWRESLSAGLSCEKEWESSSMESLMDIETKKCHPRHPPYSSYSPCRKQSIIVTLPRDYVKIRSLSLPAPFLRDNGISKPCTMYLSDTDGKRWPINLLQDNKGTMKLGVGWKDFIKANGLNTGESFGLRLTWEDTTPVLSLCPTETESFVATVTAWNLRTDTLCLPQHFTSSNGISEKCHQIVIKYGERLWTLDVEFNKSSDTFYISRGWKSFCDDNGQTAGGFFMFTLVDNGETPVLSFCPTKSTDDTRERDCSETSLREFVSSGLNSEKEGEISSMQSFMDIEKKKCSPRHPPYSSYSPCRKQSIKVTLPRDYVRIRPLNLPAPFLRDNGISKPCMMYLLDRDGKKWSTNLRMDNKGTMRIGVGWIDFVKANGLKTGESFELKLTWEDTTPVLSLCLTEFSIDRRAGGCSTTNQKMALPIEPISCKKTIKEENIEVETLSLDSGKNHLRERDSSPSNQNPFVTLNIARSNSGRLIIPAQFARENSINKPGMMIYLSRKDGTKWLTVLLQGKDGRVSLGKGWREFAEANGLNSGDSFMVELIWEDATPILRLVSSEANEKEPVSTEPRSKDSFSAIQNFCDDIDQTAGGFLPVENGETPVLSFCPMESAVDTMQKECSQASWRESIPPRLSSEKAKEGESSSMESLMDIEKKKCNLRHQPYSSYSPCHKQSIKVTLPRDYVKIRSLSLPAPFLRDNGISKPCTMYLLDTDGKKWHINLLQDNKGTVKLGVGWKDFIKANGLNTGEPFGLKLTWEDTTPVLSLCPAEFSTDRGAGGCSTTNQKEPLPIEPSSCKEVIREENMEEEIFSWDIGKNHPGQRDSSPSNQNRFVTLRIARAGFKKCRLVIPAQFARENSLNKPGMMIYMSRKDGTKWSTILLQDKEGRVSLGRGWKEFAEANNLKSGESFKVELTWEDATPILSLVCSEAEKDPISTETRSSAIQDRLVCSEANEKETDSTEPRSIDSFSAIQNQLVFSEVKKELVSTESRSRDSFAEIQDRLVCSEADEKEPISTEPRNEDPSSAIQNRFVRLALTPEDIKTCKLHLPSQFMKDNGINRLGKITILGENKTEMTAYLMSRDGNVVLGNGWEEFCETNGVKLGESFTLEFISEQNTTPVLKLCAQKTAYKLY